MAGFCCFDENIQCWLLCLFPLSSNWHLYSFFPLFFLSSLFRCPQFGCMAFRTVQQSLRPQVDMLYTVCVHITFPFATLQCGNFLVFKSIFPTTVPWPGSKMYTLQAPNQNESKAINHHLAGNSIRNCNIIDRLNRIITVSLM